MKCPTCGAGDYRVVRTDAQADGSTRRILDCTPCGKRWVTREVPEPVFQRAVEITELFEKMKSAVGE